MASHKTIAKLDNGKMVEYNAEAATKDCLDDQWIWIGYGQTYSIDDIVISVSNRRFSHFFTFSEKHPYHPGFKQFEESKKAHRKYIIEDDKHKEKWVKNNLHEKYQKIPAKWVNVQYVVPCPCSCSEVV